MILFDDLAADSLTLLRFPGACSSFSFFRSSPDIEGLSELLEIRIRWESDGGADGSGVIVGRDSESVDATSSVEDGRMVIGVVGGHT